MSNPESARFSIEDSLNRVERWVEKHNYRGYEPFDGLSSWFRPLTFGTLLGDRLLLQLIRQCPINLRPIMGVPRKDSTKGQGYMASGYLARFRKPPAESMPVHQTQLGWVTPWGVVDWADIDASGLIRVFGWSHQPSERLPVSPALSDCRSAVRHGSARAARGDAGALGGVSFCEVRREAVRMCLALERHSLSP